MESQRIATGCPQCGKAVLPRCGCGERLGRTPTGHPVCSSNPDHTIKAPHSRCRCGYLARCPECREVKQFSTFTLTNPMCARCAEREKK